MTTIAPSEILRSELGRAVRVFKGDNGSVFKLAQHTETGQWAIWLMTTETHDEDRLWAETKHLSVDEVIEVMDDYKLKTPIEKALKVDDDISPEYAKENEGIFEMRCLNIISSVSANLDI
jgi:hypothetical protein